MSDDKRNYMLLMRKLGRRLLVPDFADLHRWEGLLRHDLSGDLHRKLLQLSKPAPSTSTRR